jgi:hypothetical protein
LQLTNGAGKLLTKGWGQAFKRLIQEQELGTAHQRPRQSDQLLLPTAQL